MKKFILPLLLTACVAVSMASPLPNKIGIEQFKHEHIQVGNTLKSVYTYFPEKHAGVITIHQTSEYVLNEWLKSDTASVFCNAAIANGFAIIITDATEVEQADANKDGKISWMDTPIMIDKNMDLQVMKAVLSRLVDKGDILTSDLYFAACDDKNEAFGKLLISRVGYAASGKINQVGLDSFISAVKAKRAKKDYVLDANLKRPVLWFSAKVSDNNDKVTLSYPKPDSLPVTVKIFNDRGREVYSHELTPTKEGIVEITEAKLKPHTWYHVELLANEIKYTAKISTNK